MTPDTEQNLEVLLNGKQPRQPEPLLAEEEGEATSAPQKGLNIRPFLRTIQRKALLIAGITTLTTGAAAYVGVNAPATYGGSFQLLVEPVTSEARLAEPSTLTRNQGRVPDEKAFELDYSTVFTLLTGPGMFSSIVEQVRTEYPNFSVGQLASGLTIERLTSEKFGGKTKIVHVTYQSSDPKLVKIVLDKTSQRFLRYSLEERKTYIGEGIKFIEDQLPNLQKQVDTLQGQIQNLQQKYNIIDPTKEGSELFAQVRQAGLQQLETQRQLEEQKILYLNLQEQLRLTPDDALAASSLSENPNYQQLVAQIKEVERQIALESARFLPDSPQLQALTEKRQNLQALLDGEKQEILGTKVTSAADNPEVSAFQNNTRQGLIKQLVDTENQIKVLELRNQSLARTKNKFELQAQNFPAVANQYSIIQRQLEIASRTLDQLLTQRESLKIEAAQNTVPWELISKPLIPTDAAGNPIPQSNFSKMVIVGLGAGLVLGIVLAILYEKSRNIFYTVEDIEDTTKLPLLGKIPRSREKRKQSSPSLSPFNRGIKEIGLGDGQDSLLLDPSLIEAFDSLYTNIRFSFFNPQIRSLAICSAGKEDGKSTVAWHLAQTAAAIGKKVLLVDGNLRSPQLHHQLNLQNSKGLCDLLQTTLEPKEAIQQLSPTESLFVLTAGDPSRESPKRLASAHMQHLMENFHARFDLVIYDTPNLLDYTDASFLAANTDGILLVTVVGQTQQSLVQKTLAQLDKFGLPILGVVANRLDPKYV